MDDFTQDGHLTEEAISGYVEALSREDTGQVPLVIREHIEACTRCHAEALALYSVLAEVRRNELVGDTDQKDSGQWIRMRVLRWAMVAVLAGISFYLYRYQDRPAENSHMNANRPLAGEEVEADSLREPLKQEETVISPTDEAGESSGRRSLPDPTEVQKRLYAANFVPSETLEGLLSGQFRGSKLDLIRPRLKDTFGLRESILFEWQGSTAGNLYLRIENNREEEVYQAVLSDLRHEFEMEDLEPGIYYWRLESEEDLIMLGRLVKQ